MKSYNRIKPKSISGCSMYRYRIFRNEWVNLILDFRDLPGSNAPIMPVILIQYSLFNDKSKIKNYQFKDYIQSKDKDRFYFIAILRINKAHTFYMSCMYRVVQKNFNPILLNFFRHLLTT